MYSRSFCVLCVPFAYFVGGGGGGVGVGGDAVVIDAFSFIYSFYLGGKRSFSSKCDCVICLNFHSACFVIH